MPSNYATRAVEILRKEGIVELSRAATRFLRSGLVTHTPLTETHHHRFCTLANRWIARLKYDAPADPYETIYVNPNEITHRNMSINPIYGLGQIKGGDWDISENIPLDDYATVRGLKQRFEEGNDWEETVYYRRAKRELEKEDADTFWGYSDPDQFLEGRCSFVDELYDSMKRGGYLRNEAEDLPTAPPPPVGRKSSQYYEPLDILVYITRDGGWQLNDGHHRVAIARILNISRVPVQVICRHRKWQVLRDDVYTDGLSEEHGTAIRSHPDLQDIVT